MREEGLWKLFFLTGLPEVYLALQAVRSDVAELQEKPAMTAFVPRPDDKVES